MPDLPTITVTAPQAAKLLAAFPVGVPEYKAWLKVAVRDEVLRRTVISLDEAHNVAKRDALMTLEGELPPVDEVPE